MRLAYRLRRDYMQKRMPQTSISLLYALREAADACDERMTPICAMAGLTLAQFNLLYLVVEEKRTRLGELAENSRCVKSNVTYLVRSMEADGLLEVSADPDDRRVRHVRATPKGTKALRAALRSAAQLEKALRTGLGEKAIDDAAERLMAIAHRLDSL